MSDAKLCDDFSVIRVNVHRLWVNNNRRAQGTSWPIIGNVESRPVDADVTFFPVSTRCRHLRFFAGCFDWQTPSLTAS
ncbi:hypothetical protein [Endozoicomonas sp. SCSIO W0465]|uniref:hypothetical protein n=1 Tax=Endozoicomonas sp. SCSIO W0465 TaxID=2918516 RepID=UPI002075B066|nr:hypothetical protein [Endozoicomonas sp. SCSIO W0465]USE34805.1 hypothetical protein MJO57_22135 [Endozoicomonas sp. SCSIO W0465]